MKKTIILALTLLLIFPFANATHVIGGDIYIEWVSQNNYKFKLRFYKDEVNAAPSALIPTTINIGVYEIGSNTLAHTFTLNRTSLSLVPLGDPCYTPDTNVINIQEGVFESSAPEFINDNPNGYYLQAQIANRNSLADNVVGTGQVMTWFAMMPDPSIGKNSSPDFGSYPPDAFFCTGSPKLIQYPITDNDGDSLAYSLVTPLGFPGTNGTTAGSLPNYPYYPALAYQTGFSATNIIGGTTPMSIDPITGIINANPSLLGFFTFAIRVEEFRDLGSGTKVKIGETRRDIQYQSQVCTSGNPPTFPDPSIVAGQTIEIEVNKETCRDFVIQDLNKTDSIYIELKSPILSGLGGYLVDKPADANGNISYFTNWTGGVYPDDGSYLTTLVTDQNYFDNTLNLPFNEGLIGQRFCWTPECEQLGETYPFEVNGFSTGCDGRSSDSLPFFIKVVPPFSGLDVIPNVFTPNGDGENDFFSLGWEYEPGARHGGTPNICTDEISIEIFNRWGDSVFKSDDLEFRWLGKVNGGVRAPSGTYFVLVSGTYGTETITLDQRTVTLLR